jgi:hypothetical protein
MANIKISDLTAASAAADANEYEINEAGTSKKVTGSQIKAYVNAGDGALAAKDTVATADIDNLAVTTGKLAADAVDGTKIADDAIGNEHIATGAVNADSIAADAVGASELNVTGNGTSGQYLASDGDGTMTWTTLAAGGGFSNIQVFNTPGTWTNPGNVEKVKVTVVGGGGGFTEVNDNAGSNRAGTGGTSSFGAYCSATGGQGAYGWATPPGDRGFGAGAGGIGSGGNLNIRGEMGNAARNNGAPTSDVLTVKGGSSYIGESAYIQVASHPGALVQGAGQYGGGGASTSTGYGSAGAGGGGTAIEVIPFPSATNVPVTVGAAGTPGNTPQNNNYQQVAGAGVVIVEY